MDLTLDPEQRLLVESARAFLSRACPTAHVRAMETDEQGFASELWREMARLGWTGIALPTELGGSGRTFLELVLLCQELGRALVPSPFLPTCAMVEPLILALGSEGQRRRWLPEIVSGELIAVPALVEPGWRD